MPRNQKSLSWWLTLVICGVIFVGTSRTAPAQERQPVAELIALMGTAEIKSPGDAQFRPAKVRDKLYQQDQFRTLADSRAKLFFKDESILVLSDNTTIDIAKFQMKSQSERQSALMKLIKGSLRFIVTKVSAADKPDFEIEGKTAIMGIRGTDGVFESRSPDTVFYLSGKNPLSFTNRTTGQTTNLTPNNFAAAVPNQPLRTGVITGPMRNQILAPFQVSQAGPPPPTVTTPPPPGPMAMRPQPMTLGNPVIPQTNPVLNTLSPGAQGNNTIVAPLPGVHELMRPGR
jgi:hypothetical protein